MKYNSPRPIVKGFTYQGNSMPSEKQSKGEPKSVNASLTNIPKSKFSSSTQIIKLTTMQSKKGVNIGVSGETFFSTDAVNSSLGDILSPKRTGSPSRHFNRPKANSHHSGSSCKGLNQNSTTMTSKTKGTAGVNISMMQQPSISHSQSVQIAPTSTKQPSKANDVI